MKTVLFTILSLFIGRIALNAQSLGEFEPREEQRLLESEVANSKNVYMAIFSVYYQLYNLRTARIQGGFTSSVSSGKTKAFFGYCY